MEQYLTIASNEHAREKWNYRVQYVTDSLPRFSIDKMVLCVNPVYVGRKWIPVSVVPLFSDAWAPERLLARIGCVKRPAEV